LLFSGDQKNMQMSLGTLTESNSPFVKTRPKLVVRKRFQRKHRLKASLLVLVVQHHHRRYTQRLLAVSARGRFTLEILHEPVREVIRRTRTPRCLCSLRPAMRTCVLDAIFERVAVERSPTCKPNANCLYRISIHDFNLN
jgi:hypothetical protein